MRAAATRGRRILCCEPDTHPLRPQATDVLHTFLRMAVSALQLHRMSSVPAALTRIIVDGSAPKASNSHHGRSPPHSVPNSRACSHVQQTVRRGRLLLRGCCLGNADGSGRGYRLGQSRSNGGNGGQRARAP